MERPIAVTYLLCSYSTSECEVLIGEPLSASAFAILQAREGGYIIFNGVSRRVSIKDIRWDLDGPVYADVELWVK